MEPEEKKVSLRRSDAWSPKPPPTGPDSRNKARFIVKHAKDIPPTEIDWLWHPYIPTGRLTILGGDPGQGKSFITSAIATAGSRGERLPGQRAGTESEFRSLMIVAEDDLSDTVVPRLQRQEADLTKIDLFDENFILDDVGIAGIRQMMEESGARLLVLDPIVAYLGEKMDMNRANEVRPRMKALADIAKDYNAAVLVVRHMRKQAAGAASGKAIYNGMGSIDFTAAVRSELQTHEGPNGQRYLMHVKANSGELGQSISYDIDTDGRFLWGNLMDRSFTTSRGGISRKFLNEDATRQFIFDTLKDKPDGVLPADIYLMGKTKGFSQTRIDHLKKGIARSEKVGSVWVWKLDPLARPAEGRA